MLPWWNPKNKLLCHIDIFFQSSAMINYMKVSFLAEALKKTGFRASLVAQWLRVCVLMQGTRVRALVWEDPTCRGATRPVSHNY